MSDSGSPRREELLEDSEVTLRQIRNLLTELEEVGSGSRPRGGDGGEHRGDCGTGAGGGDAAELGLPDLFRLLARTHAEIMTIIGGLRQSRGMLEQASLERLKRTHAKLQEVSSATEVAATGMLDGLDRALGMLDDLEELAGEGASTRRTDASELRDELREELHGMISLLQFQDITAQQLNFASSVLEELERRLLLIADLFKRMGLGEEDDAGTTDTSEASSAVSFDPKASTENAESRQALADEIFT